MFIMLYRVNGVLIGLYFIDCQVRTQEESTQKVKELNRHDQHHILLIPHLSLYTAFHFSFPTRSLHILLIQSHTSLS